MNPIKFSRLKNINNNTMQFIPYYLIALFLFNMLVVAVVAIGLLYEIGVNQQKNWLIELVETQAGMIEVVAGQERQLHETLSSDAYSNQMAEDVIRKVTKSKIHYDGFGKTGEFVLGKHEGGTIQFITKQRHYNRENTVPVPWDSKLGEPMRRALNGQKGVDVLLDYRGAAVLAAYQPIQQLGWGVVAKIDLDEVREPYIMAARNALIFTLILAVVGSALFWHFVNPLVKDIDDARQFNHMLISKSSAGLALCSLDGRFIDVNFAFSEIIGRDIEELMSLNYFDLIACDCFEHEIRRFELLKYQGSSTHHECFYMHKNGEHIPVKISGETISLNNTIYLWLSAENIQEYKAREANLLLSEAVFQNTTEIIFITDENKKIIKANKAFTTITGYTVDEVLGKTPNFLRSGKHNKHFYEKIFDTIYSEGTWRGEIWNKRKDGALFPSLQSISAIYNENGKLIRYVSLMSDITTQKAYEQQLLNYSHHDLLTGLANRLYFEQTLDQTLLRAQLTQKRFALFFIDLNHFKEINDTLGHDAGDLFLKTMAKRLKDGLRAGDFVARLGGDEFVLILESINSSDEAITVVENIIAKTGQSVLINENEILPSLSVGIAFYPDHGTDESSLLKSADKAMYYAKHHTTEYYYIYTSSL